jgi:NADP-dependent 3-hydroxy acid dehydrogenase YdfG
MSDLTGRVVAITGASSGIGEAHARAFVEGAHAEHGRLDALVNNAGVMHLGRVVVIEPGRVESELRTHVRPEVLDELGPAFAELVGLDAEVIASTIVHALAQPPDVSFSEILVRPTASAM